MCIVDLDRRRVAMAGVRFTLLQLQAKAVVEYLMPVCQVRLHRR
jgi:hypothetical protein